MTRQVDAVMEAAKLLMATVASSVAQVEDRVSLPQLRVLVMLDTQVSLNLVAVADALGVHPSNATRAVERLVVAGLIDRRDVPTDRRNVSLTLTREGQALVDSVFAHRRAVIRRVLDRMPDSRRRALPVALESFVAAAQEVLEADARPPQWAH
ncbi:MAG: MarR family transcriptional regulator [Actinomycetota bacterium]|nr:MarR family transcriptional regulator [Actinomycetota bacterium]